MSRTKREPGNKIVYKDEISKETDSSRRFRPNPAEVGTRDITDRPKTGGRHFRAPSPIVLNGIITLLLMTLLHGCIDLRPRDVCTRDYDKKEVRKKEDIYKYFNLQRGRWWNYYELGSCLLTWGHYEEALKELDIAIQKREHDKRKARTYGMHFIDYFPHRESGVAYCLWAEDVENMAKKECLFDKAMDELQTSINKEPSSKAKFYLKRATKGFWSVTKDDKKPPLVWIENDEIDRWKNVPTLYINRYAAELEIRASDDQSRIGTVWIDRKKLFVESAEEDFNEPTVVTVDPNDRERTVVVKAYDLAGNPSREAKVRLIVDTAPPIASIRVRSDMATLMDGHMPVEVIAVDDEGLKSVRMGDDLYGSRDCRGQSTWEGILYAQAGAGDIALEVADLAGNITAMNVTLAPEQSMNMRSDAPLLAMSAPLGLNQSFWKGTFDLTQRDFGNILNQLGQFSALETHHFTSLIGCGNVQEPISTEDKFPRIVLKDVKDKDTLESTSHPRYLLQGLVENADGLKHITITVDDEKPKVITVGGEEREDEKMMRHRDHVIFSAWVPLPDCNVPRLITVDGFFDGKDNPPSAGLQVQRIENCLLVPESRYSVALLPLVDEHRDKHLKQWREGNKFVCEAIRGYQDPEPNGKKFCQRFNCKPLDAWSHGRAEQKLKDYCQKKKIEKPPPDPGQRASYLAKEYEANLGFYGSFTYKDEDDTFEVTIQFTDVNHSPFSDRVIDMYASDKDREYYLEGLISKLKAMIPRVEGKIVDANLDESTIEVDLEEEYNMFNNMDLLLYHEKGPRKNPTFVKSCEAKADVRNTPVRKVTAEVVKCERGRETSWTSVAKRCKDKKDVRIISK